MFALMEIVWKLYPYNNTHLTLVSLLHYLGKFLQIFSRYWRRCKQNLIFSVFKIWSLSPYRSQIKFSMSLFFYLFTAAINLWLQKFVPADITAVFVNNQRGIQQWGQDFEKSLYLKRYTAKRLRDEFLEKAGQRMLSISCWKVAGHRHSSRSQNTLTQQPALLRATHILPKNN